MQLIGLTGGIASGKSTVSRMFAALGAEIVDADLLAREVVAPGSEGLRAVVAAFGAGILGTGGILDRKRLGEIIFADADKREALEAITHPRIFQLFCARTEEARARNLPTLLYDAPLLFERKLHLMMAQSIVVWVPRTLQRERLMRRDGLSLHDAELRLAAQMPLDEKKTIAQIVIDNSGTRARTAEQVAKVWDSLGA